MIVADYRCLKESIALNQRLTNRLLNELKKSKNTNKKT
jgi:hypothetical protein